MESQVRVERAAELLDRDARPVPMMKEFVLEPADDPHGMAARAAPFFDMDLTGLFSCRWMSSHVSGNRVPPVGIHYEASPLGKRVSRRLEAVVSELGVRARVGIGAAAVE